MKRWALPMFDTPTLGGKCPQCKLYGCRTVGDVPDLAECPYPSHGETRNAMCVCCDECRDACRTAAEEGVVLCGWLRKMRDIPVCLDCGRPYGDEHGFPDLIVPHDVWRVLNPTEDEGELLCPSCMCQRAFDAGVTCTAVFRSGPFAVDFDDGFRRWLLRAVGLQTKRARYDAILPLFEKIFGETAPQDARQLSRQDGLQETDPTRTES